MKLLIPLSVILTMFARQAQAQAHAGPFGLTWGMSQAETRSLGVSLNPKETGKYGVAVDATNLPKVLSDTLNIQLYFGFNDHLWRVVSISKMWEHDRTGAQARNRFSEVHNLLTERYGNPTDYFSIPTSTFFADSDEFAYGISTNNRFYFSEWNISDLFVELSIRANMESTYYAIIYEFKPLENNVTSHMQAKEKDAL
jgi:hypothetical protein